MTGPDQSPIDPRESLAKGPKITYENVSRHRELPRRMGIQQIFVSHAGKDAEVATELTLQLRNAGHDTKADTLDLLSLA